MSKWRDRMQGYGQEEAKPKRGFRRRDMLGNLIDDGTGFNPSAGTAALGGLARWEAMNPNAMSAAARLRKENPGLRNPELPPEPPPATRPSDGAGIPASPYDELPVIGTGGTKPFRDPDLLPGVWDRRDGGALDNFLQPSWRKPGPASLPPGAVPNGQGSYYVPGMGDTDDGIIFRQISRPQFEPKAEPLKYQPRSTTREELQEVKATQATSVRRPQTKPSALGHGLSRWHELNPNPQSPARRGAQRLA